MQAVINICVRNDRHSNHAMHYIKYCEDMDKAIDYIKSDCREELTDEHIKEMREGKSLWVWEW